MTEDDLYSVVCGLLHLGHGKGGGPEEALNRVFQKSLKMSLGESASLPKLSRKNVVVRAEARRTQDLAAISNRPPLDLSASPYPPGDQRRFKSKVRKTRDVPVILAAFDGKEYLMDGNRRVRYWMENGCPPMQAYVCYIK